MKRVLIAIDFSDPARSAFYAGINIATKLEAETWVVHVSEPIRAFDFGKKRYAETAQTIDRVEQGVRRRVDELWTEGKLDAVDRRKVHQLVRGGKAHREIVAAAREKEVDLIVMGSHGMGGSTAELGRTARKVIREAPCSVLCVRAPAQTQAQA